MTETTIGAEQNEQELLTYEISDEALESATSTESEKSGNYTLALCTWLTGCPI